MLMMVINNNNTMKLLLLGLFLVAANGAPRGSKIQPRTTLVVDQSGHGNFSTLQAAIDAVPGHNVEWICIRVSAGLYREKVQIPYEKPYIIIKGAGKRRTWVVWDATEPIDSSATFTSLADNVVVKAMSFRNSFNNPVNTDNDRAPALAAMIVGDKSSFYRVGFHGLQDTLWDAKGRHYYKRCTIQGAVDFIFGAGQSLFENCGISVLGAALTLGQPGYITAQGRNNLNDPDGFVFKDCFVHGNGTTFLGRPWRPFARVLFYNSNFSSIIEPAGWEPWHNTDGNEEQLTFVEHGCYGPGADTSRRVSWEKKLNAEDVGKFASLDFIDTEGWLDNQPF